MRTIIRHTARAVSVNGQLIPAAEIAREARNHPESDPKLSLEAARRALIVRELLRQRAAALHLRAEPAVQDGARETDEDACIRALLAREAAPVPVTENECLDYWRAMRDQGEAQSYERLREAIRARLIRRAWGRAVVDYIARLHRGAAIENVPDPPTPRRPPFDQIGNDAWPHVLSALNRGANVAGARPEP